jgi:hypothetical protein
MGNESIQITVPNSPRTATSATWVEMKLPSAQSLLRYCAWGVGRILFSGFMFCIHATKTSLKVGIGICEMTERASKHLLKVYDGLPYAGSPVSQIVEATATLVEEIAEVITDLPAAIEAKQVMIIGGTGAGKSTVAQYLAYTIGGKVRVLECEGTPDDWQGLEVVGRGEDWQAIDTAMALELQELSRRVDIRNEQGDKALLGTDEITIVEEYPEVRQKCSTADDWFERHARRGRKMRRFVICLSQFDRVAAWGLEGKSDLEDCFYKLRLGKTAINHAKKLKNDTLVEWLKQNQCHCLLDDAPCRLPPYREMKLTTARYGSTIAQVNHNNVISPEKAPKKDLKTAQDEDFEENCSDGERVLWQLIQRVGSGKSDSAVVTEILGFTGKRYSEGKNLLERLRSQFGK